MKRIILLFLLPTLFISTLTAQKRSKKNDKATTAYAITSLEKGQNRWTEVRLIDLATGEELKTIYKSNQEIQALNARTGSPVVKKNVEQRTANVAYTIQPKFVQGQALIEQPVQVQKKKVVNLDQELDKVNVVVRSKVNTNVNSNVNVNVNTDVNNRIIIERRAIAAPRVQSDKPFATNSAACAYDKKHERLYYTPLGLNQLRYIDLKASTPAFYYYEDDAFGVVTGYSDVQNQITRMVINADGEGYALSNNAEHLIRFGTDKKATITDLGALTDDPANGNASIHSPNFYGGDMIADAAGDLYLITANRRVFKIDVDTKVATYKGVITGLPQGYTTNGAIVEGGTTVIVNSANSTEGYYKFDINTLQAEKLSSSQTVFNSSDLASSVVITAEKKKKQKEEPQPIVTTPEQPKIEEVSKSTNPAQQTETTVENKVGIFPNPVVNGYFKLSFEDQPAGKYQIQLIDISGKLIKSQQINVNNKVQVEEFRLPETALAGNYMVKIVNDVNKVVSVSKVIVQ